MKAEQEKKIVKTIKVDADKCNGCRVCEMICSAVHAEPKYSRINPARARIRIIRDPFTDKFIPVFAGAFTAAECVGREKYTIAGKEYDECAFCKAACPSREDFVACVHEQLSLIYQYYLFPTLHKKALLYAVQFQKH